jgi:hypothetical protein
MECPECGGDTKVRTTRSFKKPGGDSVFVARVALLSKTRFFTARQTACLCGWSGTTVEMTEQHLRWLLEQTGQSIPEPPQAIKPLTTKVRAWVEGGSIHLALGEAEIQSTPRGPMEVKQPIHPLIQRGSRTHLVWDLIVDAEEPLSFRQICDSLRIPEKKQSAFRGQLNVAVKRGVLIRPLDEGGAVRRGYYDISGSK